MNKSNKKSYLATFLQEKQEKDAIKKINTGFKNLDKYKFIAPGLYLFGGTPSVGKTTFILQLIDQLAMNNQPVMFFSLEQSEYDLTNKSITRIMNENNCSIEEAIEIYKEYAVNITTCYSEKDISMDDISTAIVSRMTMPNCQKPIVFIDYLQLISSGPGNAREKINEISQRLVNLRKTYDLTIFVISSFSRSNYYAQVDMESFKESGNLEYDADVLLGLQYEILNDPIFETQNTNKKRQLIQEAKTQDIRKVELVCVKNRYGEIYNKFYFDYDTKNQLFISKEDANKQRKDIISF